MTMKRHFDEDLQILRDELLRMGGLCEEMLRQAIELLVKREESLLGRVKASEERVNQLHIDIDEHVLRLIALHQPAAGDLRLLAAALKINSDLERIGDQAVNIAESSMYLRRQPRLKLGDIPRMVELASDMVRESLDAFARCDVELAQKVIAKDDEEDRLKSQTFNELLHLMQSDSSTIQRGMDIILIARNLERIADHATNIAEDVVFMVMGKDIRHGAGQGPAEPEPGPAGPEQAEPPAPLP
ncbi:MAG: phosphate signaling complex protein PhoU [Elusimicrobia bacterium]|nr:phosphate signaling complex protein PhoU [Elusimicrobiota bacterium]MDE2426518.1 phosphate signaling complex protein PhoU [Elusimicrobiota bacterium]